uniref:Uncharacterized protein n=1 Tax=Siphoviridae sp. ctrvp54 TaxID=2825690 RepID=A0A8S5P8C7_9CAUD|nr:MAG TPA: hypothetical protein [Siphoviridae sp. ctrvp54]
MTINEYISQLINTNTIMHLNMNSKEPANVNKMIYVAYHMGRDSVAREIPDEHFAQEIVNTFGGDPAFKKYEWDYDPDGNFSNYYDVTVKIIDHSTTDEWHNECEYTTSLDLDDFLPGGAVGDYFTLKEIYDAIENELYEEALDKMYDEFSQKGPAEKEAAKDIAHAIIDYYEDSIKNDYENRIEDIQNGDFKIDNYVRGKMIADGKLPKE